MLLETIGHALALDVNWFIEVILGNLVWVFLFAVLGYFFYSKKAFKGGIFLAILMYATTDFANALGWKFNNGLFVLIPLFMGILFFDSFFENQQWYLKKKGIVVSILFYSSFIFINLW